MNWDYLYFLLRKPFFLHSQWAVWEPETCRAPIPGPPTQCYLGYAICSYPFFESTPYLRTANISEPPFRGLFACFSCLGDPPKSGKMLNVPPLIRNNFSGVQRDERKKEKHPLFKEISGWKVKYTPFFTILGPDFVARKVPLYRTFWQHACGHSDLWVGGPGADHKKNLQKFFIYLAYSQIYSCINNPCIHLFIRSRFHSFSA